MLCCITRCSSYNVSIYLCVYVCCVCVYFLPETHNSNDIITIFCMFCRDFFAFYVLRQAHKFSIHLQQQFFLPGSFHLSIFLSIHFTMSPQSLYLPIYPYIYPVCVRFFFRDRLQTKKEKKTIM